MPRLRSCGSAGGRNTRRSLHHGPGLALTLGLALNLALGGTGSAQVFLTEEQHRQSFLDEVPHLVDGTLDDRRTICARGLAPEHQANLAARGTPFPDAAEFCPAVLREVLRRGRMAALYMREAIVLGPGVHGAQLWGIVNDAAKANHGRYSVGGRSFALGGALAVDAGAAEGYLNPGRPVVPQASEADIDAMLAQCYDPAASPAAAHCQAAGQRLGQRIYRSLQADAG